jgi:Uncharacterized protein conserved in bacteria (DUF2188)
MRQKRGITMNSRRLTVAWQAGRWSVELRPEGNVLAIHRRQRDATRAARDHARQECLPLIIYDRQGNVRETADYTQKARGRRAIRTGTGRPVTVAGRRGTTLA